MTRAEAAHIVPGLNTSLVLSWRSATSMMMLKLTVSVDIDDCKMATKYNTFLLQ